MTQPYWHVIYTNSDGSQLNRKTFTDEPTMAAFLKPMQTRLPKPVIIDHEGNERQWDVAMQPAMVWRR